MGFSRQEYWSGLPFPSPGNKKEVKRKKKKSLVFLRLSSILGSHTFFFLFFHWREIAVLFLVAQLCLTLCDPMDCSPPGFSVYGDSPGKNARVGLPCPSWKWLRKKLKHSWFFKTLQHPGFSYFFFSFFFNWWIITLQYYGFCHTSTWISHRYTRVPSLLISPPTVLPTPPL